jgi:hypothetical protein
MPRAYPQMAGAKVAGNLQRMLGFLDDHEYALSV